MQSYAYTTKVKCVNSIGSIRWTTMHALKMTFFHLDGSFHHKKGLHLETAMSQCWVYLYKNIRFLALEEKPPSLSLTLCALLILFRVDRLMCAPS